jgi:hypothetical protein
MEGGGNHAKKVFLALKGSVVSILCVAEVLEALWMSARSVLSAKEPRRTSFSPYEGEW